MSESDVNVNNYLKLNWTSKNDPRHNRKNPHRQTLMRTALALLTKSVGASAGTFVLSEESPDRMDDIIEVDGWDLKAFKKNPMVLWQHKHDQPIGIWKSIRIEGKQLLADLHLGSTNLAQMAQQLIDDGILKAVSVGFVPKEHEPIDPEDPWGGWRITAAELLEASLVSVPAHPKALLLSKSFGLSPEEKQAVFESSQNSKHPNSTASGVMKRAKLALAAADAALPTR